MPQAGFDPPGEKWQLCLNIVVALPPKPPRLDVITGYSTKYLAWPLNLTTNMASKPKYRGGLNTERVWYSDGPKSFDLVLTIQKPN